MRHTLATATLVLLLPVAATADQLAAFSPDLAERLQVQYVFIGYEPEQVNPMTFLAQLPAESRPVVRSRLWYGVTEPLGIHTTYNHRITFTTTAYEDAFFSALTALARPAPLTLYQQMYNEQEKNVLEVTDNHFIDAPSVEKWLIDHPPPDVDTRRNTIFFINWHGRPDFKFHVYSKTGEPDPDTGYDFGASRESRKVIAYGGSTPDDEETGLGGRGERRVWFYDLSAGPESWTDNWNVDNADLDDDGQVEYRMPPIWEYLATGGFRESAALSSDLGKVARYVGLNLLFAPSPLYPPMLTPLRQPATINIDLNTFEGWPGVDASVQYQKPDLLVNELGKLHRIPYTQDQQDLAFEGQARECLLSWLADVPCFPRRPYSAFSNLFIYTGLNLPQFLDGGGQYEAILQSFATETEAPLLGYADDNAIDGTQSFVFNFISPGLVEAGYGLTTTQIHEYGHHIGMSHPHDGYDAESGLDYGPEGAFYFAWSGDEVNSVMSYVDLNWDFSQFDRDNHNRWQAAAYLTNARAIVKQILASKKPRHGSKEPTHVGKELAAAAVHFGLARVALHKHDYVGTFDQAGRGYERVLAAAAQAGVPVEPSYNGWVVLPEVPDPEAAPSLKAARRYSFQDGLEHRNRR
jgi:hypothetical protein